MTTPAQHGRLLRVSKGTQTILSNFAEGESLASHFGTTISDLKERATADRLKLGEHFLAVGNTMRRSRTRDWRSVIGRYYYAMYHAMRAVSFFSLGGDDSEAHSKLSGSIPTDFPLGSVRANELKDARLRRNEADYDPYPYPSDVAYFRSTAVSLDPVANNFVEECRAYLKNKGCNHL